MLSRNTLNSIILCFSILPNGHYNVHIPTRVCYQHTSQCTLWCQLNLTMYFQSSNTLTVWKKFIPRSRKLIVHKLWIEFEPKQFEKQNKIILHTLFSKKKCFRNLHFWRSIMQILIIILFHQLNIICSACH